MGTRTRGRDGLNTRPRRGFRSAGLGIVAIMLIVTLQSGTPRTYDAERRSAQPYGQSTASGPPTDPDLGFRAVDRAKYPDSTTSEGNQSRPLLALHPNPDTLNSSTTNARRAALAYNAMQSTLFLPEARLYLETSPKVLENEYSWVWPLSQVFASTIDLTDLPGIGDAYRDEVSRRLIALESYWSPDNVPPAYSSYIAPPVGPGGDVFYDDNAWIGLELVRWYRETDDPAVLDRARLVFDYVASGWEDDPSVAAPGGVYWTRASGNQNRNTVSTAPGAELALHLYQLTGEQTYLDWGQRMYDWMNTYMLGPDGLFLDHMDLQGNISPWVFSYNQGAMIGANVMLYRISRDDGYLRRAEEIARLSLEKYASGAFDDQSVYINTIFFKKLLMLYAHNGNASYIVAMQDYADRIWDTRVDPATYLMMTRDLHILIDQAAIVQLYASLAALGESTDTSP